MLKTKLLNLSNNRNFLQASVAILLLMLFVVIILATAAYQDYKSLSKQVSLDPNIFDYVEYTDSGLGIKFNYPSTWRINTKINIDSKYEDPKVPVGLIPDIAELEVLVNSVDSTQVRFVHFFGPLEKSVSQFDARGKVYKVLENKLLRYQSNDRSKWFYVDIVDCIESKTDLDSDLTPELCIGDYFSGFVAGPSRVIVSGKTDLATLDIVDSIVLSAQRLE